MRQLTARNAHGALPVEENSSGEWQVSVSIIEDPTGFNDIKSCWDAPQHAVLERSLFRQILPMDLEVRVLEYPRNFL